ncbi:MAG: FixH family protein [Niveispirillum sp.]|nr:FixH family protein [Niveispirillum sp.]
MKKDRWIPWAFVGFFVFLAVVQGSFVTVAIRTFPGLVTDRPYATGLSYNQVLKEQAAEAALGWQVETTFTADSPLSGHLTATVRDAQGQPLDVAVEAQAERMTRFPQVVTLTATVIGPGRTALPMHLPVAGRWFVRLTLRQGDHHVQRIVEVEVWP